MRQFRDSGQSFALAEARGRPKKEHRMKSENKPSINRRTDIVDLEIEVDSHCGASSDRALKLDLSLAVVVVGYARGGKLWPLAPMHCRDIKESTF